MIELPLRGMRMEGVGSLAGWNAQDFHRKRMTRPGIGRFRIPAERLRKFPPRADEFPFRRSPWTFLDFVAVYFSHRWLLQLRQNRFWCKSRSRSVEAGSERHSLRTVAECSLARFE